MENSRPKRCVIKPNYKDLSDVKLPKLSKRVSVSKCVSVQMVDRRLYRLNVLEEDKAKGLVKISYISYGSEWDE